MIKIINFLELRNLQTLLNIILMCFASENTKNTKQHNNKQTMSTEL